MTVGISGDAQSTLVYLWIACLHGLSSEPLLPNFECNAAAKTFALEDLGPDISPFARNSPHHVDSKHSIFDSITWATCEAEKKTPYHADLKHSNSASIAWTACEDEKKTAQKTAQPQ